MWCKPGGSNEPPTIPILSTACIILFIVNYCFDYSIMASSELRKLVEKKAPQKKGPADFTDSFKPEGAQSPQKRSFLEFGSEYDEFPESSLGKRTVHNGVGLDGRIKY